MSAAAAGPLRFSAASWKRRRGARTARSPRGRPESWVPSWWRPTRCGAGGRLRPGVPRRRTGEVGGGEGREGRAGRRVMVAAAGGGVGERARLAAASGSLRGAGGSGLRPGSVLRCLPLSAADSLPPLRKPSNSSRPALVPTLKPERE